MGCHHSHRPFPPLPSCGDLSCHGAYGQDDCNWGLFTISDHKKNAFHSLYYKLEVKTTQIAYCGSFQMQLCVAWLVYRLNRLGCHDTNFLTMVTYDRQPNTKLYSQKKIFTYTPTHTSTTCPLSPNIYYGLSSGACLELLLSGDCIIENKSSLVQVMAVWRQAKSLGQCVCRHMASLGHYELQ